MTNVAGVNSSIPPPQSSPALVTSCCAQSSPRLLRRILRSNFAGRSFAAGSRPQSASSAYRSWRLLHRCCTKATLAPCKGQSAAGLPFRLRSAWPGPRTQRPRFFLTACASLAPHDAAGAPYACPARCTPCPGPPCRTCLLTLGGKSSTAAAARHTAASV